MRKKLKIAQVGKNCVACGSCVVVCPRGAIEIKFGIKAYVNAERCVGCGLCANICPAGMIEVVKRGESNESK